MPRRMNGGRWAAYTAAVGSVAWQHSSFGQGFGHVAYVLKVNANSTGDIQEYSRYSNGVYDGVYHTETVPVSSRSGFIHLQDLAPPIQTTANVDATSPTNDGSDSLALVAPKPGGDVMVNMGLAVNGRGYWMHQWWSDRHTPWNALTPMVGDVNGDRNADYIYLLYTPIGAVVCVAGSTGSAVSTPAGRWLDLTGWDYSRIKTSLGDVADDGAEDVVLTYREPAGHVPVHAARSKDTWFVAPQLWWWEQYTSWDWMTPLVGDVDGNGVVDYTFLTPSALGTRPGYSPRPT